MQQHANLVDLVKSFPTNIYLQNLASIQERTSPVKFAHLAEKSGKGSISNLSSKRRTKRSGGAAGTQKARPLRRSSQKIRAKTGFDTTANEPSKVPTSDDELNTFIQTIRILFICSPIPTPEGFRFAHVLLTRRRPLGEN